MAVAPIPSPAAPGPYIHAFAITPADGTVFPVATRAIYTGGGGNAMVLFAGDTVPVLLTGLLPGWWYEYSVTMVKATGTTATTIVGLY